MPRKKRSRDPDRGRGEPRRLSGPGAAADIAGPPAGLIGQPGLPSQPGLPGGDAGLTSGGHPAQPVHAAAGTGAALPDGTSPPSSTLPRYLDKGLRLLATVPSSTAEIPISAGQSLSCDTANVVAKASYPGV